MAGKKVKIKKETMAKIVNAVKLAGYSSVEEFVETAVTRELERIEQSDGYTAEEEAIVKERLKGLGYLD